MTEEHPSPAGPSMADRTTQWGLLGLVLAPCCPPVGVVFTVLCYRQAKYLGRRPTLAYVGLALHVVALAAYLALYVSGRLDFSLTVG